jgi:hypothetical protein
MVFTAAGDHNKLAAVCAATQTEVCAKDEGRATVWARERSSGRCNENQWKAVEVVLAPEGARVVRLPMSDVHWQFSLEHSVESNSAFAEQTLKPEEPS